MKPILPVDLGNDVVILEVIYYEPYSGKNSCQDDILLIVYIEDGIKKFKFIKEPEMEIFFTKDQYKNDWKYPREMVEEEKLDPVVTKYKNLLPTIYRELKARYSDPTTSSYLNIYEEAIKYKQFNQRKELHKHPHVFFSDIAIPDYYRIVASKQYNTEIAYNLKMGFLDIEADMHYYTTEESEMGENHITAINLILNFDPKTKKPGYHVFSFFYRNHELYPQQKEFEENLDSFIEDCHKRFDNFKAIIKGKDRYYDLKADYHVKFFDTELDLIEAMFMVIHKASPDTIAIFNIAYDIPKIRERLIKLRKDPRNVMCHPSIPESIRIVECKPDNRPGIAAEDKKTTTTISGFTKYVCTYILGAAARKGRKSIGGDSLDVVCAHLFGANKEKFKVGVSVFNAAVFDFYRFAIYSVKDVWLMVMMEIIAQYVQTAFYNSNSGACPIETIVKKTIYLRNADYLDYWRMGFIHGNNINNDYIRGYVDEKADAMREMLEALEKRKKQNEESEEDDDDSDPYANMTDEEIIALEEQWSIVKEFEKLSEEIYNDTYSRKIKLIGAIVADPIKKTRNGVELVKGRKSRHVFNRCEDKDYTAMYPTIQITRAMSRMAEIGRLIIGKKISKRQNELNNPLYLPGGEFIKDFFSDCLFSFMNVWFNLKTFEEYKEEYREWRKKHGNKNV